MHLRMQGQKFIFFVFILLLINMLNVNIINKMKSFDIDPYITFCFSGIFAVKVAHLHSLLHWILTPSMAHNLRLMIQAPECRCLTNRTSLQEERKLL